MTEETIEISSSSSKAYIRTNGAYVQSVILDGVDLLKESHDGKDTHGGMAMLLPFANRIRNARYTWNNQSYDLPKNNGEHSIHGLTRDVEWTVAHRGKSSTSLWYKLDTGEYPVPLYIKVTYSISEFSFVVEIEARNEGEVSAPFMAGMHPYFLLDGSWHIESQKTLLYLNYRDSYFPDGSFNPALPGNIGSKSNMTYDNTFIAGDSVHLVSGKRKVMITNDGMPFLVVYNGEYAEGKSVALEPMTGAPDSFNNRIGLVIIKPGEEFRCMARFDLRM